MSNEANKIEDLKEKAEETVEKLNAFIKSKTDDPGEKEAWNAVCSFIEFMVKKSKTKIDDAVFLPLISVFRNRYHI